MTIENILVLKLAAPQGFSEGMSISLVRAGLSEISYMMTANS
jgi:hypothetical protein